MKSPGGWCGRSCGKSLVKVNRSFTTGNKFCLRATAQLRFVFESLWVQSKVLTGIYDLDFRMNQTLNQLKT